MSIKKLFWSSFLKKIQHRKNRGHCGPTPFLPWVKCYNQAVELLEAAQKFKHQVHAQRYLEEVRRMVQ